MMEKPAIKEQRIYRTVCIFSFRFLKMMVYLPYPSSSYS